jgi:SAM-dependent methyltransferase
MKKTIAEHAARFDEHAPDYDEDNSEEYRATVSLVVEHARHHADDGTVLDLGCGTGAVGLALADDAARVVGRDISEGMLEVARQKAAERGLENVDVGEGRFREPNYDAPVDAETATPSRAHGSGAPVDVVVSNFAMHHLSDAEKREAVATIADLDPAAFVLGDVMFFGEPDPEEPFYSPDVDDPSTVGHLADCLTDAGFALTAVERVHDQVGVLVAERLDA